MDEESSRSFCRVDSTTLESMLDLSAQLYGQEGWEWNREHARRAAEALIAAPESGEILLIEAGGQAVGILVMTIGWSLEFGGRFGLVDELFVAEQWRGHGIGMQALQFAEQWCRERDMEAVRLEVWTGNPGAIRLYQRAGFALEERHLMTRRI
ncbi:MAG TPA: GNAT family N-acetyltransferase [Bryobacteraceae bacterium]|nr:GNAT family N-acetyltransferase [Bryobacteraceae bacterium]